MIKKIGPAVVAIVIAAVYLFPSSLLADPVKKVVEGPKPRIESAEKPDVKRAAPLLRAVEPSVNPSLKNADPLLAPQAAPLSLQSAEPTLGPNLLANPSVENADSNGNPTGWFKGGYGSNSRVLSYPASGLNGSKSLSLTITNYSSGDAKWYPSDVPVQGGSSYQFSDYYSSNATSIIDVRYKLSDGTYKYEDLATLPPSSGFTAASVQFTAPSNAVSATIFHLLNRNGTLSTDEFSLNLVGGTPPPPPPPAGNLVPNGNLETGGISPDLWGRGRWGSNSAAFTYPSPGAGGSKAARVDISAYSSGDAKWYFNPIALSPGVYTYSDSYISSVPTYITVQYQFSDGSYSYKDLAVTAPTASFGSISVEFSVPSNTKNVTVFHLIKAVGYLSIDNVSVSEKSSSSGIFSTGAVTFRFDDGLQSQYVNAFPKLKSAGLSGTFYVVTQQLSDNGYLDFMSRAELADLYKSGFEIGAHTRTHQDLTTLSLMAAQDEIVLSRKDLLSWNLGPVMSFSYPYGAYNANVIQMVKNAGFTSAAATLDGFVSPTSDKYQLERFNMTSNVTLYEAEQAIDAAIKDKEWIVLTFHGVDLSGTLYSTTPAIFSQVVDYVVSRHIPVVTISQGVNSLQ